ncbi:MAG: tetratricopeptide repeat protein [Anaerolineae bacterium]|nr:tetratricopeptide repeat protein [Anaerolineae bacterium]
MGNVARALNDNESAKQRYLTSFELREAFHDREGMAVALSHLGEIALLEQDYREASKLFQQSLAFYEDLGDKGGLTRALQGLGSATCGLGEYQAAGPILSSGTRNCCQRIDGFHDARCARRHCQPATAN